MSLHSRARFTLGSVFVIVSSPLIEWFGWTCVDPLCSLILSLLILGSAYPLLKSSAATLLQNIPEEMEGQLEHALLDSLEVEGVESYSDAHLWQLKSDLNVASVHIQATAEANAQLIRHKVLALLKAAGANQSSVQVKKAQFHSRIVQLCPAWRPSERISKGNCIPRERARRGLGGDHGHSHGGGGHGHSHDHHGHSH